MLDVRLLLLLALTAALFIALQPRTRDFIADRYARLRGRSPSRATVANSMIIDRTGNEIPMPEERSRAFANWPDRVQALMRSRRLLAALALILVGALALRQAPYLLAPNQTGRFVVLVAPFADQGGAVGQTGRSVADQLVEQLQQRNDGRIVVRGLADPPADSAAALQELDRSGADALIWGQVLPGSVLNQQSLLPLLAYRPNGGFAPVSWDGYNGRFAMPVSYVLANAPINGQATLPLLLGALVDYDDGRIDPAFKTLGALADDYSALLPTLPRALRGNVLWARGDYDQAAGEYRRALSMDERNQAAWTQQSQGTVPNPLPLLANNLGAILQDAGDPAAHDAFAQARALAQGQDLGALHYNLGLDALRAGQLDQAIPELEQARSLSPAATPTPLLLSLSEAYRRSGSFDQAQATYDAAFSQIRAEADTAPSAVRDLTLNRLRAAALQQSALIKLAKLLNGSGPLAWQLDASPPLPADALNTIRDDLASSADQTSSLAQEWNRRSTVEDAAERPIAGLIAIGQARRAEQLLRDRQRWRAAVEIEIARSGAPPRGIAALWARVAASRMPLGQATARLNELLASAPSDVDALLLLGRAQLVAQDRTAALIQFAKAAAAAPRRPEPVYGQALAREPDNRDMARALQEQAISIDPEFFPARQKLADLTEDAGDWPATIEQRRWLARERPSSANSVALARTLRMSGPSGYAEAEQTLLPRANADDVAALTELGRLYLANNNLPAAATVLERAQRDAPNDPAVAFERGRLLAAQNNNEQAAEQFQKAIDANPQDIQARLELARVAPSATTAEQQYRAALDAGASDPAALKQIGAAMLAGGEPDLAISAYERAVNAAPDDIESRHALARAYLQRKRFDDAVAQEQEAIRRRNGHDPEALVGLGDIALARGDAQGAIDNYNAAIQQDDKLTAAYLGIGRANAAQDRWSVAVGQFQSAVSRDPGSAEAHLWLGEALIRQNTQSATADAINEYNSAIKLKPDYTEAYFGLAQAQAGANQQSAAQQNLAQALSMRPNYAEAWLLQGKLYEQSGDETNAIAAYGKSISANSNLEEPYYRRAKLRIRRNDMSAAESDLEAATKIRQNFPDAHYWLGRAYFAEGRAAAARDQFRLAVSQRSGDYAEARFYQGLAEEQLGQRDDAAESYKAALAQGGNSDWASEAQAALARLGQP